MIIAVVILKLPKTIKVFANRQRDQVVIPSSSEHCRFLETVLTFPRINL